MSSIRWLWRPRYENVYFDKCINMSLYIPEIRSEKPERRSGHICVQFRDNVFVWGGFNVRITFCFAENFTITASLAHNILFWNILYFQDGIQDFVTLETEYLPGVSLWIYNISTCIWFVVNHSIASLVSDSSFSCATCSSRYACAFTSGVLILRDRMTGQVVYLKDLRWIAQFGP